MTHLPTIDPNFRGHPSICCSASFPLAQESGGPIVRPYSVCREPSENCWGSFSTCHPTGLFKGSSENHAKIPLKITLGWEGICDSSFPEGYVFFPLVCLIWTIYRPSIRGNFKVQICPLCEVDIWPLASRTKNMMCRQTKKNAMCVEY